MKLTTIVILMCFSLIACKEESKTPKKESTIIRYSLKSKVKEDTKAGKLYGCWQPNGNSACKLSKCKNYVLLDEVESKKDSNDDCKDELVRIIVNGNVYNK